MTLTGMGKFSPIQVNLAECVLSVIAKTQFVLPMTRELLLIFFREFHDGKIRENLVDYWKLYFCPSSLGNPRENFRYSTQTSSSPSTRQLSVIRKSGNHL
jgi:hypothetical protein